LQQNPTTNPSLNRQNYDFVESNDESNVLIGFKYDDETGNLWVNLVLIDELLSSIKSEEEEKKLQKQQKAKAIANSYFAHVTYEGEIILSCSQECEHEDGIDRSFRAYTKEEAYEKAHEYLYEGCE
jgi:hypothetical protein